MDLYINLNHQPGKKQYKKRYSILTVLTLFLAIGTFVLLISDHSELNRVFGWIYVFYFLLLSAAFYLQSKGRHIIDLLGKSYFRINDQGVECKPAMFDQKVIKFSWSEVDYITMKLFEIQVKVHKRIETINLEKLSDENLQLVKSIFKKHQTDIVAKDIMLVEEDLPIKFF
ncbi:MAG: hypothetical protein HC819_03195 [Cyclobacteriaceae bacterium]|nr:hypothetical protein [Cyclobacteriaceae bacterium]